MQEQDEEQLRAIVTRYLPQAKMYLFGSRARGDHQKTSDIDIALDNGEVIDSYTLSLIREAVEESWIPFFVDIVDVHAISQELKEQILKDGVRWL